MRRCLLILALAAILSVALAIPALSQGNVDFWFAAQGDATGTPISSINVPAGATFTVSIWYKTNIAWSHNALEVLVGYDQTNMTGNLAVPIDGKITATAPAAFNIAPTWVNVLANTVGGGNGTGTRPYGLQIALGAEFATDVTTTTAARICDVTLKNAAIPGGGSYPVTISNNSNFQRGWTSYLVKNLTALIDSAPATLTVTSGASQPISIGDAKKKADGDPVVCAGIVTAPLPAKPTANYFYMESAGREFGIRVEYAEHGRVADNGVQVSGAMRTTPTGERYIEVGSPPSSATAGHILPFGMTNKAVGGGNWFVDGTKGQKGVTGGVGTNNVGLLVRVWGTITGTGDGYINIDDGSGVTVRVDSSKLTNPPTSGYIGVIGICSLNTGYTRMVVPRDDTDVNRF